MLTMPINIVLFFLHLQEHHLTIDKGLTKYGRNLRFSFLLKLIDRNVLPANDVHNSSNFVLDQFICDGVQIFAG